MQTHLRDDANGSGLAVDAELDALDVRTEDILNSGYQLVVEPATGESLRLLEVWECPTCGRNDNCALVTIDGTQITSIEAVVLDRAMLERTHFISDQCFILAAQLSDVSAADLASRVVSPVETLRASVLSAPVEAAPKERCSRIQAVTIEDEISVTSPPPNRRRSGTAAKPT